MSFVAEPVDTAPTTIPPSPPVDSHSISDDDRAEALKLKAQANKAFQSKLKHARPLSPS
ncbi:hypothetical protein BOTBODRAFT_26014 [Botryobasidium botryosum FD-172 SS1]|uniref:Uncharacterized protein n=1 Tax=Botryobasidium botryosum (strain FD-172 SS1) TaxID=930990 RepID=A0A067NCQ6_BOTB1|nr:hypothetical protein BOTBODRAFT_26014 [Botryobasidium botryosum FD-172 SS1]